jgi:hypothetical protein
LSWFETARGTIAYLQLICRSPIQIDREQYSRLREELFAALYQSNIAYRVALIWGNEERVALLIDIRKKMRNAASFIHQAFDNAAGSDASIHAADRLMREVDAPLKRLADLFYRESFPVVMQRLRGEDPQSNE